MVSKRGKYKPMGLDDKFRFGKYKGSELWLVIDTDTQYICWLIEDSDMDFYLDNEAYEYYKNHLK